MNDRHCGMIRSRAAAFLLGLGTLLVVLLFTAAVPVHAQILPGLPGEAQSEAETPADEGTFDASAPVVGEQNYQEAEAQLEKARSEIDRIRARLDEDAANDAELTDMRVALEGLAEQMITLGVEISPRLGEIRGRLDQIGSPPEDSGSEPQIVTEERARLTEERARVNALIGSAEEISVTASRAAEEVTDLRRALFTETLLARTPVDAELLGEAWTIFAAEVREFRATIAGWLGDLWQAQRGALLRALFLSLVAALVLLAGSYRLFGGLVARDPANEAPSYVSRLSVAFWSTVIPTAAASAFAVSVYGLMEAMGLLRETVAQILALSLAVVVATYFVIQITFAVLTPARPRWRLIEVSGRGARTLCIYVVAIALVSSFDYFASGLSTILGSDVAVTVAKTFFAVVVIGALLIALSYVRPMQVDEERYGRAATPADYQRRQRWTPVIGISLRVAGAGLILLALAGYVGLARFIASQIIVTGAILATMYIGFLCGRAVASVDDFSSTSVGRFLSERMKLGSIALDQAGLACSLAIYLLVLTLGVPLILLQWGFQPQDIRSWVVRAFTEIRFGNVSISLVAIGVGLLVFAVGYLVTRWFQRWVDGNVLARGRVDAGVRNSISTAVGYAGVAVAGIVGVSAAGLDLSNLALVAGALSLGIGFGLQTIVSNFVSGLILLAERPFKVGDWVVTGTTEGYVKRISVRATEIETFQRQSIIVPNSELINASVGNWTHRNQLGRLEVPVRVAYDSDPRRVIAILLEIAQANELVMRNPEPYVTFSNFGDFALEFELRVFLGDVLMGLDVATELRVAIFERFREEGIVIPFPQQEVVIRPPGEARGQFSGKALPPAGRHGTADEPAGEGLGDLPGSGEGEAR